MNTNKPLRILITNDDGYNSTGIKILEQIARTITDDVWVVAPAEEQSGKGHALTYRDPLRLKEVSERHYTVNGTPTDCVIIALRKLLKDHQPDFVLSGVNNGENVAESITHSGTIGAAMEATLHGVKAIALSQVSMECYPTDWSVTRAYGEIVLKKVFLQEWQSNTLLNINFPHAKEGIVQGMRVVRHGRRSEMGGMVECLDPRGFPYYWVGVLHNEVNPPENTDLWGAINNFITITPIQMDLTCYRAMENLESGLSYDFDADMQKIA
ncbi:MAG: 5'/3'-nucleotidase SurE [Alphaproteobacteria bacterium]|nr:5'/3'-nucleotidase SurE [Alphaproteobacteria bacterium]